MSAVKRTIILLLLASYYVHGQDDHSDSTESSWIHWGAVQTPYTVLIWLLIASVGKIVFQKMKTLAAVIPDSGLLIILGLGIGIILVNLNTNVNISLDSHSFFIYLLPPIIFDAGYFMPNTALFENTDSVMLFAVVGTIWNTLSIGGSLLALSYFNLFSVSCTGHELFLFSALISAVDPVAVIAVFEEININEFLFINVFGEALFNDGITVVLYQMFKLFLTDGKEVHDTGDYLLGSLNLILVTTGGVAIGIIFGLLTGLATKYTDVARVLAPVFIFILPYMGYLTAEMLQLSSIMAIAVCGMIMKPYVKGNISQSATNSVKYFTKMLAQSSETVIFMFLGLSTISSAHYIDIPFMLSTICLCVLCRTIGVIVQCAFLNKFRTKKFTRIDQFVLSYGGLRGAIAFGLASSIPDSIQAKPMFITTTISVIFFSVFLQGITVKPLLKLLNVETKVHRNPTMTETVYNKYLLYMMSGIEDIAGQKGHYTFIDNFERFDAKILRPVLLRNEPRKDFDASAIVRAYAKITLEDALNLTKQKNSMKLENRQLSMVKAEDARFSRKVYTIPTHRSGNFVADDNLEALYELFSNLLDQKLQTLEKNNPQINHSDDIQDDYMQQMRTTNSMSRLNSTHIPPFRDNLPVLQPSTRTQSMDDIFSR